MTEFQVIETDPSEYEPPSYNKPGRLLVKLDASDSIVYRYDVEVVDYDDDSSVFWINEGVGFEFWFDQYVDLELVEPGWFVFEGIVGEYIRGDGWHTDDDEEWDWALCRRATESEIQFEYLS